MRLFHISEKEGRRCAASPLRESLHYL